MTAVRKVLTIFGTRPEAIKMAPLIRMLQTDPRVACRVAVTAQHREMLDQVLRLFSIKPDYDLDIMQTGQTLSDITCRAVSGLGQILATDKPELVLIHGDTTTTFAGALAAFYQQIPVGHVEAGLRSQNKYSPFPEEMNRTLTGKLSDLHFAPTKTAEQNLLNEGINPKQIYVTGNTVIDALLQTVKPIYRFSDPRLANVDFSAHRVLVVTTHRRENLGGPLRQVYLALKDILREFPDVLLVFPVHKNPAVRSVVEEELGENPQVLLIEPLDYEPFANLLNKAYLVLTDSGGLQEEAPALGKPVLVLRENTERPEAVNVGTVLLVGTQRQTIYAAAKRLLTEPKDYQRMAQAINPYGDGRAAVRICEALYHYWGWSKNKPEHFG